MGPNTAWDLKTNSRGTQTDLVTDRNIAECLMELKSTPEFQGLAYRVCKTCNGDVSLMVTRSDSVGLLGVPIDPVTVIVTSSSLCYVSALFAPLEVVNLKPNGHFTLRLFRNVLRKLNGRAGFGFCPGFKEEYFPSHFNFQKHGLEVTRQPFTRIHAAGCPVFFQQRKPRPGGQELGLELCTRCLQVGMGVCETLKDSGAEGEIPGLIRSLTKSNHSLSKNHHDHHNELSSERGHLSSCDGHRSVSPAHSGSDIRTDPHAKGTLPSSKQMSSPKSPTKKQRHSASSESFNATASSASPSSKVPSAITAATSNSTNHVKLGTVQKGVKPYRIIAPRAKNHNSSSDTTSDGYGDLENSISLPIVRLKRCDSASVDYDPPLLIAETSSVPSSPQLCIDEDADPDTLEPAVDGETDAKRQCLRCPLCAETFSMQSSLDQHLQQRHQAETKDVAATGLEPSSPEQVEDQKPSLQKHKTCPVCTQHFVSKDELEVHLRERHNTRLHACRFCGQKFALKSNLSSHLLSHTGSAHLKCQECGAKFSKKKKYAEHIRQHMGSLPFFCKICTKLFSREKTYEEHMERHKTRRAMKSLVGTEKMTQGIMDKARRCLEDKAQMAASWSDKKQVSSLSASNCSSSKSESTTGEHAEPMQDDAFRDTNHSVSEHSHSAEAAQSKHALSSNLHLLSVVSLAQAKLDQVYTVQTSQQEQAKPGSLTSGVELRDLALQETVESARELGYTEHCESTSPFGTVHDSVDKFTSRAENNSNRAENLASKSEDGENPLMHAATGIVNSADGCMHSGGNPGTVLQGLNAPSCSSITTSFNPSSVSHNSASARTSPVNQSSSTFSHKDCQSEDSRLVMAGDNAEGEEQEGKFQEREIAENHALIELEKRERQIQEKERVLKEREMAMRKMNLSFMQQLFLAKLAQGQMPAPSSLQSKGGIGVPRFVLPRVPVTALPFYTLSENGIATPFGPAVPSLDVLKNSGLKTSDRDFLMLSRPHMTVAGDMAPPRPQPRPAAKVQQQAPQKVELSIVSLFGHAASGAVNSTGDGTLKGVKRHEPGGDKSRLPDADGAVRRRRPMTTPTPPPPDATPNFLSSSKGPASGAPPAPTTILTSSTARRTAASTNDPATDSPAKPSSVTGVPTLGGMAMLQQIWKLESKLPESAKQFLPSAGKRKQPTSKTKSPMFHNFTPSQPNIPSTVLPSSGHDGSSKTKRRTSQLPPVGSETGSVDRSPLGGWSGGMMLGKDKLRSPVMIVPPNEMQRLLSLTKPKTPPPVTSQSSPRPSTSLDNTLPSPPSSVSAQRESANVDSVQLSPAVDSNDSLRSPVSSSNSAHSPVNIPSALSPPANVNFNPLPHAVTSSVNSTGSCMQKGVKQRRPANAENSMHSPAASNSSPFLPVSANGMLRSPVTSDVMRHSPTPSVTSQRSPATQQLTPTQSELSPPPPAYQQSASRSSPNNNTLAAQLAAKAAAITAPRMAALSPTGLPVHFPIPTVIHSAPSITHSFGHSVIQSTAPTVAHTLSQPLLHSATPSVAHNPPHSGIYSSAASVVSVSSSSVGLPHRSSTVTVASRQTAVPYASPPPLYLRNAAGGLPMTVPAPDLDDATPIDLTKPGSRSSSGGKSLDGYRTVGKETANNAAVRENGVSSFPQVHNSLLLRKFLLDRDIPSPAEKMNSLTSQLAALHSCRTSPGLAAHAVNSRSQPVQNKQTAAVLQLQSHPPTVVSPQGPSPTHGIPVSLHAPASSQASPLSPHVFSLQGHMSPQSSTPIPVQSRAVGQPQVSLISPQLSALGQSQRGLRLQEGPLSQVRLTRIDGIPVPISLAMLAQVQGMAQPRFAMPTQGLIPPQGLVSPSEATTQQRMPSPVRAVASPPPSYSQQGMQPPHRALGSPPPYPQEPRPAPPPNFLLPVSRTTQAAAQTEDCAVDRKSTVPLGGFTWHRPAALDPSYGPQLAEEQNAGTDGDLTQHQTRTEDGSTNTDDQGSPRTASSAWQEQFLQTLKKQRRHQEQQQRVFDAQRQQLLQQELSPLTKQQRPRKPRDPNKPQRQSRPRKKKYDASQPESAGEGGDHISRHPFSPQPNFSTSTMSVQNNTTESIAASGSEALLSMPVIVDEQPAKKPRKRQSRKRKPTRKADANAMEQEHNNNKEEDCARESGTGTQLQQSEYLLSCDSCGKVFSSEADILHHECDGE